MMMLYRRIETGELSLTISEVRRLLPLVSIPEGGEVEGFSGYAEVEQPKVAWDERAAEQPPIGGEQVWAVEKLTGNDLARAQAYREGERLAAVAAQFAARIAAGLPYAGQVIDIDDGARADLSGMGTTAGFVIAGLVPEWPQGMATGWVARGNQHVPLPTPQEGLKLALTAAGYYSALVQHEAALIADPSADPASGWPSAA